MIMNRKVLNGPMNRVAVPITNVEIDLQDQVATVRKTKTVQVTPVRILNANGNSKSSANDRKKCFINIFSVVVFFYYHRFVLFQVNAAGQIVGSSDSEQHRSDGNDSDGSMMNLNEDLKPISYYIKDRERMLKEMFRCVRGHKLQAILPDALKVTLMKRKISCWYMMILLRKDLKFFFVRSPNTSYKQVRLIIDPCFRLIHKI